MHAKFTYKNFYLSLVFALRKHYTVDTVNIFSAISTILYLAEITYAKMSTFLVVSLVITDLHIKTMCLTKH